MILGLVKFINQDSTLSGTVVVVFLNKTFRYDAVVLCCYHNFVIVKSILKI